MFLLWIELCNSKNNVNDLNVYFKNHKIYGGFGTKITFLDQLYETEYFDSLTLSPVNESPGIEISRDGSKRKPDGSIGQKCWDYFWCFIVSTGRVGLYNYHQELDLKIDTTQIINKVGITKMISLASVAHVAR